MKNLQCAIMGFLFLASSSAFAHGGGHAQAPIKAEEAKRVAIKVVEGAVKGKKIENSWARIKPNQPTTKDYGHGPEWVVTFDNPNAKDKDKNKLFVFLSIGGELLGVNHTGK